MTHKLQYTLIALFGLSGLKFLITMFTSLDFIIARTLSDDAFYYLTIARNAWDKKVFPTFDGINLTNGFHYLYQLILIPLSPLYSLNLQTTYTIILTLNAALFLLSNFFLWKILKKFLPTRASIPCIAFILLSYFPFKIVNTGMEVSLSFLLSMLFLWLLFCHESKAWQKGLVLGLLIITRLDIGAMYALVYGFSLLYRQIKNPKNSKYLTEFITVVLVSAAFVIPVLSYNYYLFGHPTTISQATKKWAATKAQTDSQGNFSSIAFTKRVSKDSIYYIKNILGRIVSDPITVPYILISGKSPRMDDLKSITNYLLAHKWKWALSLLFIFALSLIFNRLIAKSSNDSHQPFPPLLLYLFLLAPLLHLIAVIFIISFHGGLWYWLHMCLAIAISLALLARKDKGIISWISRLILIFLAISGALWGIFLPIRSGALNSTYTETSWFSYAVDVSEYLNSKVEPTAIVGSFNAGLLGYISPVPVINLDGLANNWELLEARKNGLFREYIFEKNINYLSDIGSWNKYLEEINFKETEVELLYQSPTSSGYLLKINPKRVYSSDNKKHYTSKNWLKTNIIISD